MAKELPRNVLLHWPLGLGGSSGFACSPIAGTTWRSGWGPQGAPLTHRQVFIKHMFWVEHSAGFSGVTK